MPTAWKAVEATIQNAFQGALGTPVQLQQWSVAGNGLTLEFNVAGNPKDPASAIKSVVTQNGGAILVAIEQGSPYVQYEGLKMGGAAYSGLVTYTNGDLIFVASAASTGGPAAGSVDTSSGGSPPAPATTSTSTSPAQTKPFVLSPVGQTLVNDATTVARRESEYSWVLVTTLPTGNVSTTTFALDPNSISAADSGPEIPGSPLHGFKIAHTSTPGILDWSYRYIVRRSTFPRNPVVSADGKAPPDWLLASIESFLGAKPAHAYGGQNVAVTVRGQFSLFDQTQISQFEHALNAAGNSQPSQGGQGTGMGTATQSPTSALDGSGSYADLTTRLADLRACAVNPTDPIVQKSYKQDPAVKQQILGEIDAAISDIRSNTQVQFISSLNAQTNGFDESTVPGFVLGSLSPWVNLELTLSSQSKLLEIEKLVPECTPQWLGTVSFTIKAGKTVPAHPSGDPNVVVTGQTTESAEYTEHADITQGSSTLIDSDGVLRGKFPVRANATAYKAFAQTSDKQTFGTCDSSTSTVLQTEEQIADKWTVNGDASGPTNFTVQIRRDGSYTVSYRPLGVALSGTETKSDNSTDTRVCSSPGHPVQATPTPATSAKNDVFTLGLFTASGRVRSLNNLDTLSGSQTFAWDDGFATGTATLEWNLRKETPPPANPPPFGPPPLPSPPTPKPQGG